MSYNRVLPRDLFNEAKLLKCMGKLTLLIHDGMIDGLAFGYEGEDFQILQDATDGSIQIANLDIMLTGANCDDLLFWTPLNSRANWPLMCGVNGEEAQVFTEAGELQHEFVELIAKYI